MAEARVNGAATGAGDGVWVGLDLGTSGVKAVALRADGSLAARAAATYATARPSAQAAEQDPDDWIRSCTEVVRTLAATVPAGAWRGIGLAAMIPTLVVLDAHQAPLGPAITWEDGRAERHGERLRAAVGPERLYERTGQWLDGRYLLPMYARLASAQPELAARARQLVAAKDLLFHWLTGELLTDPSTATGFGAYDARARRWLEEPLDALAEELGAAPPRLPAIEASTATRSLRGAAAGALGLAAGLPVCLGAADSVLGALGLDATAPGDVAYISGTSNVLLASAGVWVPDPQHRYLLTPLAHDDARFGLEMDLLAAGSAIRWLARLLAGRDGEAARDGRDEAALVAAAGEIEPAAAPVFLPYLAPGEQGALWNPELRGTLVGLELGQDGRQLARGLLNGIVLESRRCIEVLEEAVGAAGPLHVAGWCAADAGVRRDLADCSRRVLHAAPAGAGDCSAVGAALLLAHALGEPPVKRTGGEETRPDERRARVWDALWERHERARDAVTPLYEHREALCTET